MIVAILQRALGLVLMERPEAFAAVESSDIQRLVVHRYLATAMAESGLDDRQQRQMIASFRDLCEAVVEPAALHPLVRDDVRRTRREARSCDTLLAQTAAMLRVVLVLARWRYPRCLGGDPFYVDLEAGEGAPQHASPANRTIREPLARD